MTTKPDPNAPKEPRALLDGSKPFVVMLHQTGSRDNYRTFEGDSREFEAAEAANVVAGRGGTAFILEPRKIFTPPKEPVVETKSLNFGAENADPVVGD